MATLATAVLVPASAGGYGQQVHFFSNISILDHSVPQANEPQRRLISFCSQLPDETRAFDALGQYSRLVTGSSWHWLTWGIASRRGAEPTREMIAVQQLLHGLTGGRVDELSRAADRIVERLASTMDWSREDGSQANALCAIGFSLHLLADSRSHQRLGNEVMYPTGRGHAGSGTKPDSVLGSAVGVTGWRTYLIHVPPVMRRGSRFGASKLKELRDAVDAEIAEAGGRWSDAAPGILEAIRGSAAAWPIYPDLGASAPWEKHECQAYVNRVFKSGVLRGCTPRCLAVWEAFSQVAIPAFNTLHPSRSPALGADEYVTPRIADPAPWRAPGSTCP